VPGVASGAVVDAEGGITIWISYDNLDTWKGSTIDASPASKRLDFDELAGMGLNSLGQPVMTCASTEDACKTHDPSSQSLSCAASTTYADAREKVKADILKLARYIHDSTEGRHFLRRVYVADQGRGWDTADVQWNVGKGGIAYSLNPDAHRAGWNYAQMHVHLHSAWRTCSPDVLHHELGHYLYGLLDRYPRPDQPYPGCFPAPLDGELIEVTLHQTNPEYVEETVMSGTFPHRFVDDSNVKLRVTHAGLGNYQGRSSQELTGDVLKDSDPSNDGPNRWAACTLPFARGEWSMLGAAHIDLEDVHVEGEFPDMTTEPLPNATPDIRFVSSNDPNPGTVLLLDNSNSMNAPANDPASRHVQEAALFFYHSSAQPTVSTAANPQAKPGEYVGAFLYNNQVSTLVAYGEFDSNHPIDVPAFPNASGSTNINLALASAIQALEEAHAGTSGANGGTIVLLSDGQATAGGDLWNEVRRAGEMGIKIHPRSYGVANSETMEEIAAYSSGSDEILSAPSSPAELKLDLCREVTILRGSTSVYSCKGKVSDVAKDSIACESEIERGFDESREFVQSTFNVPNGTRDLLFYVFLEDGNAAELTLELGQGGTLEEIPSEPLAKKGRFHGVRIPDVDPGEWTFRIKAPSSPSGAQSLLPADDNIEIVAYANHPELTTDVWIEESRGAKPATLKARLTYRYPLSGIQAQAVFYDGGRRLRPKPTPMWQGKPGPDRDKHDGVYSTLIDLETMRSEVGAERVRIDVEFAIGQDAMPAPNIAYEPGTVWSDVKSDYMTLKNTTEFKAYGTLVTSLDRTDRAPPAIHKIHRIPRRLRRRLPGGGPYIGATVRNAHPLKEQTRVSLGQGVTGKVIAAHPHRCKSRTTLWIEYQIADAARPGQRNLGLQFGRTILWKDDALELDAP